MTATAARIRSMVEDYKAAHPEVLADNPDFREWLENEYVPIAGGWQY